MGSSESPPSFPGHRVRLEGLPQLGDEVCRAVGPGWQVDVADGPPAVPHAEVDAVRVLEEVALDGGRGEQEYNEEILQNQ